MDDKIQLTMTEITVLKFVSEGCTNEEIANKLYTSQATISTHLSNIYNKLDVTIKNGHSNGTQRVKAVLYFLKNKDRLLNQISLMTEKYKKRLYATNLYRKIKEMEKLEESIMGEVIQCENQ